MLADVVVCLTSEVQIKTQRLIVSWSIQGWVSRNQHHDHQVNISKVCLLHVQPCHCNCHPLPSCYIYFALKALCSGDFNHHLGRLACTAVLHTFFRKKWTVSSPFSLLFWQKKSSMHMSNTDSMLLKQSPPSYVVKMLNDLCAFWYRQHRIAATKWTVMMSRKPWEG